MAYCSTPARLQRDQPLREHILGCALEVVAEGGFSARSMSRLASTAGIVTGSLCRAVSAADQTGY